MDEPYWMTWSCNVINVVGVLETNLISEVLCREDVTVHDWTSILSISTMYLTNGSQLPVSSRSTQYIVCCMFLWCLL